MGRQFDHLADVEAFVTIVDKGTILSLIHI